MSTKATEPPRIVFRASLPPIQSAILLDGRGDGGRIKLDVPASDAGALLLLQHHGCDRLLKVTIEIMDSDCFSTELD